MEESSIENENIDFGPVFDPAKATGIPGFAKDPLAD